MKGVLYGVFLGLLVACDGGQERVLRREGEPDMVRLTSEDKRMNAAIDSARATLLTFEAALLLPPETITRVAIKVGLETADGGHEHIWLADPALTRDSVSGLVSNEPVDLAAVQLGQRISVSRALVSDWMYVQDSALIGGFTVKALMEKQSAQERAQLLDEIGVRH